MKWFSGWRNGRVTPRTYPVALLSFDRPKYLRQVLKSLRPLVISDDQIFLFQDGAWNRHSNRWKAERSDIETCVQLFRRFFPQGVVIQSEENLGIAWNYERAERHVFETLGATAGLFLEDDLILSPNYLDVTDMLLDLARRNDRIGYVSAYGDFWATPAQQAARLDHLIPMHENWGSAQTRSSWLAERTFRRDYLALVENTDYSLRDHERIRQFYRNRGWQVDITSQDCARWIACAERGAVRVTTAACHARYIGKIGEHFTPKIYRDGRFARSIPYKGALTKLAKPDDAAIEAWLAAEIARFKGANAGFKGGHPRFKQT
jgi:hypothetical protein